MERYKEVISFANQANLALAARNYQDALAAYTIALKSPENWSDRHACQSHQYTRFGNWKTQGGNHLSFGMNDLLLTSILKSASKNGCWRSMTYSTSLQNVTY